GQQIEVETLPQRAAGTANAAARLADGAAKGDEAGGDARGRSSHGGEHDTDTERCEYAPAADTARRAGELKRAERGHRPERAGAEREHEALEQRERQEVAAARAAGAQECEVATVALRG